MRFNGPLVHTERDAQLLWFGKIGLAIGDDYPRATFPTNRDRGTNNRQLFKPYYRCYTWYLSSKNETVAIPLMTRTLGTKNIGDITVNFLAGLVGAKDKLRHHGGKPKRKETGGWFSWVKRNLTGKGKLSEEEREKVLSEAEELPELGYDDSEDKAGEFIRRTELMEVLDEFTPNNLYEITDKYLFPRYKNNWTFTSLDEGAGKRQYYIDNGFLELKANNTLQKLLDSDKVPELIKHMLEKTRDEANTGNWYVRPKDGENVIGNAMKKGWFELLKRHKKFPDPDDKKKPIDPKKKGKMGEDMKPVSENVRQKFDRYTGQHGTKSGEDMMGSAEAPADEDLCCARIKSYIKMWIGANHESFYDMYEDEIDEDLENITCKELLELIGEDKNLSRRDEFTLAGIQIPLQEQGVMAFLGVEGRGNPKDPDNDTSFWGLYQICVVEQREAHYERRIQPSDESEEYYKDIGMTDEERMEEIVTGEDKKEPRKVGGGTITYQDMSHNEKLRERMWDYEDLQRAKQGKPPIDRYLDDADRGPHGALLDHDLAVPDDEMVLWTSEHNKDCRELKEWLRDRTISIKMKDPDRMSHPTQASDIPVLQLDNTTFIQGIDEIKGYFSSRGARGPSR
tara:strand:+ start:5944 stop:7812 length:1869 start_codon:yes stop_codon:yes gene_type:complete